jgi:hypothetical protein
MWIESPPASCLQPIALTFQIRDENTFNRTGEAAFSMFVGAVTGEADSWKGIRS